MIRLRNLVGLTSILLVVFLQPVVAVGAELRTLRLSDGTEITFAIALPENFQVSETYPGLLTFPGGRQSIQSVNGSFERFWEAEARRRGFILISPAAPLGQPFFEGGVVHLPEFIRHILSSYRISRGKLHLAGNSNGGVSAFRAAVRFPELFQSLTVLAGFPTAPEDISQLDRLRALPINMFVGDGDLYWKRGMEATRQTLAELGKDVYFEVIPRNGHFLPDLSFENSGRIFDHIQP
jgi:predicted esterase